MADEYDAFLATKLSIYSILYGYFPVNKFEAIDDRGTKIIAAMTSIVNAGLYGSQTPYNAGIKIEKVGNFKEDGNYYSQEYKINCGVDVSKYTITNNAGFPTGSIITNLSDSQKTNFSGSEHFKVKIPKTQLTKDVDGIINIQVKAKTYPVFYRKITNFWYSKLCSNI